MLAIAESEYELTPQSSRYLLELALVRWTLLLVAAVQLIDGRRSATFKYLETTEDSRMEDVPYYAVYEEMIGTTLQEASIIQSGS